MFIRTALLTVICAISQLSFANSLENGTTEQVYRSGSNYLAESYDAFSPDNKTFELVLKDLDTEKYLVFQKSEKSDLVQGESILT